MTEMDELAVRDEVDRSNCFARAMERWHASRKRPDLTDEERVRGALQAYERQAFANELRRSALSPAGVTEEQVEAAAKRIFEHWQFTKPIPAIPSDGVPAWVEGGNSLMQDKARAFARAALEAAAKAHNQGEGK